MPLPSSLENGASLGMLRTFPSSWSEPIRGSFGLEESIEGILSSTHTLIDFITIMVILLYTLYAQLFEQ